MLILLPPSEGKTDRARGRPLDLDRLSFPELGATRRGLIEAVQCASARDDAASILGVAPSLRGEIERNLALDSAPTLPAGRLYSGVLYDALDLAGLESAARRRAQRWVVVVSALFGAVRLTDPIVPYRLSMAVNLPGIGPLAAAWRPALDQVLPQTAGRGVIVDCRSSTYAAAWTPPGEMAERWVHIRVPEATHMAKRTRGLAVRHLTEVGYPVRRPEDLPAALTGGFEATLTPPSRARKPWILDVRTSA